jgi:hypothetical protein
MYRYNYIYIKKYFWSYLNVTDVLLQFILIAPGKPGTYNFFFDLQYYSGIKESELSF